MALKSSAKSTKAAPTEAGPQSAKSRVRAMLLLGLLLSACVVGSAGYLLARQAAVPLPAAGAAVGYQETVANAMKYAQALQNGQFQQALLQLNWVQERLERVRAAQGTAEAENAALAQLVEEISTSARTGAVLRVEGIEDQFVFVPRALVGYSAADAGRADLERPTAGRAWLRVSYPEPAIAPKDVDGRSIKTLTVGLNVAADGRILKAEIVGNLEIDRFSIGYF